MTVSADSWEQVRRRANFACEYCSVTETDTGGELTVDHFHPKSQGGSDDLTNLLYCCHRCNIYKADYAPGSPSDPTLWNPRQDARDIHLLLLANGALHPISVSGAVTLSRLRLNRPQLVGYRRRKLAQSNDQQLLKRCRDLAALLEQLHEQHAALLQEQRTLLSEQRVLLQLLLERSD